MIYKERMGARTLTNVTLEHMFFIRDAGYKIKFDLRSVLGGAPRSNNFDIGDKRCRYFSSFVIYPSTDGS